MEFPNSRHELVKNLVNQIIAPEIEQEVTYLKLFHILQDFYSLTKGRVFYIM